MYIVLQVLKHVREEYKLYHIKVPIFEILNVLFVCIVQKC